MPIIRSFKNFLNFSFTVLIISDFSNKNDENWMLFAIGLKLILFSKRILQNVNTTYEDNCFDITYYKNKLKCSIFVIKITQARCI